MPGILGVFKQDSKQNASGLMDKMVLAMDPEKRYRVDGGEIDGVSLGRTSLGVLSALKQPVENEGKTLCVIFHGEIYTNDSGMSDPEYILKKYGEKGDACASGLNGVFHFAILDRRSREIKLFSDKFGLQPLYYAIAEKGFTFAGEVKGLLADGEISREPDYRSLADFLHFGQVLGKKTLFRDIELLPPGSVLTFNLQNGRHTLEPYFRLENFFAKKGDPPSAVSPDAAVDGFLKAIDLRRRNKEVLGLSISAGLDSRGILAGLGGQAAGMHTYTLGLPGCADQRLAERMARVAGTRHQFVPLETTYLSDFETMAGAMIRLSDGMYHPHESTEMLALEFFKKASFKVLLRGHGGEIAKAALAYPVMAHSRISSFTSAKESLEYIFRSTNLVLKDVEPDNLFQPAFREVMKTAPWQSLQDSCGRASETLAPADACVYYYINEHIRRQVVPSLEIFRSQIEIRMPYVDEGFIAQVLRLPLPERNTGEIQTRIIHKSMPGLIKIPNSNTGAPLDAGPLRLFVTDKFNSLLKKLSVRGFRHYTEFQKWHRESFKESSERLIFGERTRSRNLYNLEFLRQVFDRHMSGEKEYGHLLGTIAGLELWFRNFVDK